MKILMIGNEGSGKTTYMASAFGFLQKMIYGFSIKAKSEHDKEWFLKIYNNVLLNNKYPLPTDKRNVYSMDLFYYSDRVMSFEWKDYRGGIINESGSATQEFIGDIRNSDGLMLFFDSESLFNNAQNKTRTRRIVYLISERLANIQEPFCVTVVLTKFDLVLGKIDYESLCEPLNGFLQTAKNNDNICVRIVPVSCTKDGIMNIDLPLLDILHSGLLKEYIYKAAEIKELCDAAIDYANNIGLIDWALSRLCGVKTNRELASERLVEAQNRKDILDKIDVPLEELTEYINNYNLFEIQPSQTTKRKYKYKI